MNINDLIESHTRIEVSRKERADGIQTIDDTIHLPVEFKIERFASQEDYEKNNPYLVTRDGKATFGMGLATQVGSAYLWMRANDGTLGTAFNNANSYLAIGSDATAAVATQTILVAQTGSRKSQDTGFPKWGTATQNVGSNPFGSGGEQKMQWKATFGSSDGNSDWREFGVFNGATAPGSPAVPTGAGIMLDRFVSTQGTKVAAQVWTLTITITQT